MPRQIQDPNRHDRQTPVDDPGATGDARPRLSRRQALGTMSAAVSAGAAAWVVPEILTARPAAAAMSAPPVNVDVGGSGSGQVGGSVTVGGDGGSAGGGVSGGVQVQADGRSRGTELAVVSPASMFSDHRVLRGAELGSATVAGGWAFHRWVSRASEGTAVQAIDGGAAGGGSAPV